MALVAIAKAHMSFFIPLVPDQFTEGQTLSTSRTGRHSVAFFKTLLDPANKAGRNRLRLARKAPGTAGGIAQLGERLNGIQEVVSSILIGSTKNNSKMNV